MKTYYDVDRICKKYANTWNTLDDWPGMSFSLIFFLQHPGKPTFDKSHCKHYTISWFLCYLAKFLFRGSCCALVCPHRCGTHGKFIAKTRQALVHVDHFYFSLGLCGSQTCKPTAQHTTAQHTTTPYHPIAMAQHITTKHPRCALSCPALLCSAVLCCVSL